MNFRRVWNTSFPPTWKATEHDHDVWEMILVKQGSVAVHAGGQTHHGAAGSIFIFGPKTPHWEEVTSRDELKMIGVYWKSQFKSIKLPDHLHDVRGRIGHTLNWIWDLQNAYGFGLPVFDGLMAAIIFECERKRDALPEDRMIRIRDYIARAGHEKLTVGKLAKVACMSERHFLREFQEQVGLTPMAYVRKVRLENASAALAQSDRPMREIAHEVGFRDEFEFSRVFRRELGISPSLLRARSRPTKSG